MVTVPEAEHYNVWGYSSPDEVAADISGGIHASLLSGYFVFAYRGTGDLKRLVVTQTGPDTWMYGEVTTGWTALVPKASREALLGLVVPDLESRHVPTNIIDDFKYYITLQQ